MTVLAVAVAVLSACGADRPPVPPPLPVDPAGQTALPSLNALHPCDLLDPSVLVPFAEDAPPDIGGRREWRAGGVSGGGPRVPCSTRVDTIGFDLSLGAEFDDYDRWAAEPIAVGGVRAFRSASPPEDYRPICVVSVPVGFRFALQVEGRGSQGDVPCAPTEALAAAGVRLAATAPQRSPAPRPRFLRTDEPYRAAVGGCNHIVALENRCHPAPDVEVPDDPIELLAQDDASFACAVAREPVRRAYGSGMQGAITWNSCLFADRTHEIEVRVTVTDQFDALDYARMPTVAGTDVEIAGHAGRYRADESASRRNREWFVRPGRVGDGPDGPRGVIMVETGVKPGRGVMPGVRGLRPGGPDADRGEQIVRDILAERFPAR